MSKRVINVEFLPRVGPYSHVVERGGWVFVSGVVPIDMASGQMIRDDVAVATRLVWRNIARTLDRVGLGVADVVKATVYLRDMSDFAAMNEAYAEVFESEPPARTCIAVAELPADRRSRSMSSPSVSSTRGSVSVTDVRMARETIRGIAARTPLLHDEGLGRALGLEVYLKAECLQPTGSFKLRGATHKLRSLVGAGVREVVTVSSGNHGLAVAYAARRLGVRATVLVPDGTPAAKIDGAREQGAEVLVAGDLDHVDELIARAMQLADERGLVPLHPFDDPLVVAGQGTVGLEIAEDLPDVDAVLVPVGGGGLLAGTSAALRALCPRVLIFGIGPDGASSMARSFAARRPVPLDHLRRSLADGIRTPLVGAHTLPTVLASVNDVVTVDDDAIAAALRWLWTRSKLVVEPAGAVGLAALLSRAISLPPGSRVVLVLSGGNVDLARMVALV